MSIGSYVGIIKRTQFFGPASPDQWQISPAQPDGLLSSMYLVYVLRNEQSNKIYIGQTENLEKRLSQHNDPKFVKFGKNAYTKVNKGTWILTYSEVFETRIEAIKREKYLKSHIGRDWLKQILGR